MASKQCIRDVILNLISDMEQISKELIENMISNKRMRPATGHTMELTELADNLVSKNTQLKKSIKLAQEQEEIKKKMDLLKLDLNKEEEEIKNLTKSLKEAELLLATALYQAKQKLNLIRQANEHPIASEELIKYAHKISSSHSVAAPYNWEQGDLRRPYPTDLEMRSGWIGQIGQMGDFPPASTMMAMFDKQPGSVQPQHNSYTAQSAPNVTSQPAYVEGRGHMGPGDMNRPSSTASTGSNSSYAWQGDVKTGIPSMSNALSHPPSIDTKASISKDNLEDVEVMSTDSSSSSSSDSQ